MKPIDFQVSNCTFERPKSMTAEECNPLHTFRNEERVISCHALTEDDLKIMKKTRCVWLHVIGQGMPPVYIGAEYPFTEGGSDDKQ